MLVTKKANLFKIFYNLYVKRREPISIVHFLTNRCNARCSFCFIDFDDENTFKGELTIDEIKNLTKTFGNSLLNVNFTGGEPFARKDITEIAKIYLDNTTIQSIYVTTNGSLPDRAFRFAKEISDYSKDVELTFQISIDDFSANHDKVRKIDGLFKNCIETYNKIKGLDNPRVSPLISITVTHENCENIEKIYKHLRDEYRIDSIKCTIVRDEGVFKTPIEKKNKILKAYSWLTDKIKEDSEKKKIKNYSNTFQGKLHKKKDEISWKMIKSMYLESNFISPCHAGSLFGIITASGDVYPCEILSDKLLGNLRKFNMNFLSIWKNQQTKNTKEFIKKTNCNCTYECALSFNILGNLKYQPQLLSALFKY